VRSVQYLTIHRLSRIFAQFTILHNFLHNFMLKNQLYYFNSYGEFDFGRVTSWYHEAGQVDTVTRGELIPWPEASWYRDLGRVDTMTWGELIPWPGARWYWRHARCVTLGQVDTMTRGELILWPGASRYRCHARCMLLVRVDIRPGTSWYQDLGRVVTTWPEVVS
jgi:hypothetical protein